MIFFMILFFYVPTLYRIFGILLYCLIDMSNLIGIKKAWSPTAVVPLLEALALPISLEQQREAHAEYKITLVPYFDC